MLSFNHAVGFRRSISNFPMNSALLYTRISFLLALRLTYLFILFAQVFAFPLILILSCIAKISKAFRFKSEKSSVWLIYIKIINSL